VFAPPPGSDVDLLPLDDPQWDWKGFERFCLGFVKAQPGVLDARLYGTGGQDQRGIDIVADLAGGRTRTYQCRKWQAYRKAHAEHTVEETEYAADEHVILVGCEVGTTVRDYIDTVESWSLMDKEDLSRAVREIAPRERSRRLIEDTFSVAWRRAFLGPTGPLGFWETDDYFSPLLDEANLFRHTWELVGRTKILRELAEQISKDQARVLVLVGRGGIGKTRILRSLADAQKASRTVLFADDNIPITAESVEELPWTRPIVIVDDAHRRDDLAPLIGSVRHNEGRSTLVLAIRPQRLDELRAELAIAGLDPDEVWFSEPLGDLAPEDVDSLAREALREDHAHLADHLAAATSDCPLVTVIGGQLLAQRALPPELLDNETDFRRTVLDRFRDEMLGRLGDEVDAGAASEALVLMSALGPVMVDNPTIAERMAEDLGVEPHALRALLSQLEQAGLLIARGRLRRIVPDVLADHILHRAVMDIQERPTGRADALLERYGDVALVALLRNLAELDWRIGLAHPEVTLLGAFWSDLRRQFIAANAEGRLRLIQLIKPVARLAPAPVFDIVRDAIDKPAEAVTGLFGYDVADLDVRQALPALLGSIALTPRFLSDALAILWKLARADERPLNPHPEHPVRVLGDLADYQLPIPYARAVLELVRQALEQDADASQVHSPIELLRPLLAREGTTLRDTGLGVQMGSYNVSAEGTAEIRAEVRTILVQQATTGSLNNRLLAAELLGDALRQPHGFFGHEVAEEQRDQWHDDQLALLAAIDEIFASTDEPHVRFQLRGALQWHAEHSRWPDVCEQAAHIRERPMSETEELILALRNPIDGLDIEGSQAQLREFAAHLGRSANSHAELADRLDAQVSVIESLPGNVFVGSALFVALAESDRALGAALARWCVDNPDRSIARFGDSFLSVIGSGSHEEVRGMLEGLRGGDSPARRQLASYLATGTWFGEPDGPEATMLHELLVDDEPDVVDIALVAVLRLAQAHPDLAAELAAAAEIGDSQHLAEKLCMAVSKITDHFTDDQVRALLWKLRSVSRLDYWANHVLAGIAVGHREEVLDLLLDRVSEGSAHLSLEDSDADLLGGAEGDELLRLLRRVRDATVRADGGFEWQLAHFYWALASNTDASLTVLLEWLLDDDEKHVAAALELTTEMPWAATITNPAFVEEALNAAHDRGPDSLSRVRDALISATVIAGSHSRTLGQAPPRDVRLRDEGRACAERFAPDSQARKFFEAVVARAEANIAQAAVEDEEYPELP
jgi:hypothetical protein